MKFNLIHLLALAGAALAQGDEECGTNVSFYNFTADVCQSRFANVDWELRAHYASRCK